MLGPEVVQETTERVKMIQEKMRASQSRQKSYHDKRRKDIEFQVSDHVFLRVNPVTGVGRALKCQKLTPRFVGTFEIIEMIGVVAYQIALPPSLSNLHDVFHVSQLRKYVYDASHVIQVDDLEIMLNFIYAANVYAFCLRTSKDSSKGEFDESIVSVFNNLYEFILYRFYVFLFTF